MQHCIGKNRFSAMLWQILMIILQKNRKAMEPFAFSIYLGLC